MSETKNTDTVEKFKGELEESSQAYKEKLREELDEIIGELRKYGLNILLIGGGLYAGYRITKALIGSGNKEEKEAGIENVEGETGEKKKYKSRNKKHYSRFANVRNTLMRLAVLYFLSIAREKLIEYLENFEDNDEDNQDSTGHSE